MRCVRAAYLEAARQRNNTVAGTLQTSRATARSASRRGSGLARSCCLCCLGFLDVLVRFFNEFAYTQAHTLLRLLSGGVCAVRSGSAHYACHVAQVAMYGKTFTRASRDTWTLLVHHSGVEALIQRDLVRRIPVYLHSESAPAHRPSPHAQVAGALAFGALTSGVLTALIVAAWSRAAFGDGSLWWQARQHPQHIANTL